MRVARGRQRERQPHLICSICNCNSRVGLPCTPLLIIFLTRTVQQLSFLVHAPMDEEWAKESNLVRILGWTGAVHSLALICVGLRMYARLRILRTPGRDDAAIVVAVVSPI